MLWPCRWARSLALLRRLGNMDPTGSTRYNDVGSPAFAQPDDGGTGNG